MTSEIGNYAKHAQFWDWSGHDRTAEHDYWYTYAKRYGNNVLLPMCAWGATGAYMAERGMSVTAFDITPEMIAEGGKRFGDVPGLTLREGDVRDFRFDIPPADFCFSMDFGHLLTIEDVKRALACINNHLRDGGCMVIKTGMRTPGAASSAHPGETFYPLKQMYPHLKVWKTGDTRIDAQTGRCHIAQTFYAEDESGHIESFEHAFYLQSYTRDEWLEAFRESGFEVAEEREDGGSYIFEAVKATEEKKRYSPTANFDHLQTPIYRYENVTLYNDKINLEQPNSGFTQFYRFDINADGNWVGGIHVWIGYTINIRYCGQIGYEIKEEYRNRGYVTKACLALRPFLVWCGYKHVLIATDENNVPSRRVCEKIGATLKETVDTPAWTGMYRDGQRRTCIYEWAVEDVARQPFPTGLRHARIDLAADRDYILERHCRVNYECDTPWARKKSYEAYRADWFANTAQQDGFLSALTQSMDDTRTIAEIIKAESGEPVGYLWVPFHGEDASFVWADVQDIYVEEAFRKSGVASYLMDYAERMAKHSGARVIRSGTGCENIRSQGLHRKMGYYQYRFEYEKVLEEDKDDG